MKKLIKFKDTLRVGDEVVGNLYDGTVISVGEIEFVVEENGIYKTQNWWDDNEMEITKAAKPSWDNLRVGDIIVDTNDDDEAVVLVVMGDTFLKSQWKSLGKLYKTGTWMTKKEAKENMRTVKSADTEDEIDITVDGKTTRISRKSAEALNLI